MKNFTTSLKKCAAAVLVLSMTCGMTYAQREETLTLNSGTDFVTAYTALQNPGTITKLTVVNKAADGGAALGENEFQILGAMAALQELNLSQDEVTTALPDNVFSGNKTLLAIQFPANMSTLGNNAFNNSNLTGTVTFPDSFNNHNNIWHRFTNCQNITAFECSETNTGLITIDGVLFSKDNDAWLVRYPCGKTDEAYTIPEGYKKIKLDAFTNNSRLKELTLASTSGFDRIFDTFSTMTALERINVAEGHSTYASVDGMLMDKTTSTLEFCPMNYSENVVVDGSKVSVVARWCFRLLDKLKTITFTEGVTTIGQEAVRYQQNGQPGVLEAIYLPASLTNIAQDAFCQRSNVKTIVMRATTPPTFDGNNSFFGISNAEVFVPAVALETYKAADFKSNGAPDAGSFKPFYDITVTGGAAVSTIGNGIAAEGMEVTLTARPEEGQVFDHWETSIALNDANAAETTFTMGAEAVAITAVYKDAPATSVETVETDAVLLYPNPAIDFININGTMGDTYVMYSTTGAVVAQGTLAGAPVPVAHLTAGIYVVKAGDKVARFIKED